jgi:hypothetical protein
MDIPQQQFTAVLWSWLTVDNGQEIVAVSMDFPAQISPTLLLTEANQKLRHAALAVHRSGQIPAHRINAWRLNQSLQRFHGIEQHGNTNMRSLRIIAGDCNTSTEWGLRPG